MPGPKTNERDGTRAVLRHCGTSAFKVRVVLDLIRNQTVGEARDTLKLCERDAATVIGKLLDSAIANAANNDGQDPEDLYVSACYADEGPTKKTFRPRARGRAGRILKRSCHITVIVSRLPESELARVRAKRSSDQTNRRARRVAGARRTAPAAAATPTEGRNRFGRRKGRTQDVEEHDHEGHEHEETAAEAAGIVDPTEAGVEAAHEAEATEADRTDSAVESSTEDNKDEVADGDTADGDADAPDTEAPDTEAPAADDEKGQE